MKTVVLLLFTLATVVILSGCTPAPPKDSPKESTAEANPKPSVPPIELDLPALAFDCPMGYLGYPVGTYVWIEGIDDGYGMDEVMRIDTVNGEKLGKRISIWCGNTEDFGISSGKRFSVCGYETMSMISMPYDELDPEYNAMMQFTWSAHHSFIITSAVAPESQANPLPDEFAPKVVRLEREVAALSAGKTPMGRLGHPVGTFLIIEGVHDRRGTDAVVVVDTVDGKKIEPHVVVQLSGEEKERLSPGRRCTIRGYEYASMEGVPDTVAKAENLPPPQEPYRLFRPFIVRSVISSKVM